MPGRLHAVKPFRLLATLGKLFIKVANRMKHPAPGGQVSAVNPQNPLLVSSELQFPFANQWLPSTEPGRRPLESEADWPTHNPGLRVAERTFDQRPKPSRRHEGIILHKTDRITSGYRDSCIPGGVHSLVLLVDVAYFWEVSILEPTDDLGCRIRGAVVHHDELKAIVRIVLGFERGQAISQ